ncbi:MAG: carbohydrate kinase family protein [Patescibacteria group bacterium]
MYDIISIGSATRDVLLESAGLSAGGGSASGGDHSICLTPGSKIEVKKLVLATGGGGTNYAVTFARQGLKTACIGVIGKDANGQEILRELKGESVDVSMFQQHDDPPSPEGFGGASMTAYSVILVYPDGERTILSYKGEGQHFSAAQIDFSKLQSKWLFLDSLGGHYDLFEALVNHAVKNNIKIACNPGGKELAHGLEKLKPFLAHLDIFLVNKEEAASLFGEQSPREFMSKAIISISDGPQGVSVTDPEGHTYTAGIPDSPVVERTGAGDAFGSGFVSEYIRSGNIEKAIQFGTANASSVVTQFGGKAGILKQGDNGPWPLVHVDTK